GHQLEEDAREPNGFFGETSPALVDARHCAPADSERGVDGLEHGVEPFTQLAWLRHLERNAGNADLCFDTYQALTHRRRRNQERLRDARRIEAEYGLEHEGRVHSRVDCRVRAHEQQLEAFVREVRR